MNASLRIGHAKIVTWTLTVLAIGLTLYGALAGLTGLLSSNDHRDNVRAWEQQQLTNNFWLAIAGEQPADFSDQETEDLANRLAVLVSGVDSPDDLSPQSFSAPPRVYRGVTEELGFSPFDNECGNECGPITAFMVNQLSEIADGNVESLVIDEPRPVDNSSLALTGMPVLLEVLLVWQLAGAIGLVIGITQYGDPMMTWELRDGKYDREELICCAAAPAAMLVYLKWINKRNLELRRAKEAQIIDSMGLRSHLEGIRAAIADIERMPAAELNLPKVQENLQALRDAEREIVEEPYHQLQAAEGHRTARRASETSAIADKLISDAQVARQSWQEAYDELQGLSGH